MGLQITDAEARQYWSSRGGDPSADWDDVSKIRNIYNDTRGDAIPWVKVTYTAQPTSFPPIIITVGLDPAYNYVPGSSPSVSSGAIAYMLDFANGDGEDTDKINVQTQIIGTLVQYLNNGKLLDPAAVPLLTSTAYNSSTAINANLLKAVQNYVNSGMAPPTALATAATKAGIDVTGLVVSKLQTQAATSSDLQIDLLQFLKSVSPNSAVAVAKAALQNDIDSGAKLRQSTLDFLKTADAASWADIVTAKIKAVTGTDYPKSDTGLNTTWLNTSITTGSDTISNELYVLSTSSPANYASILKLRLENEIAATGTLNLDKTEVWRVYSGNSWSDTLQSTSYNSGKTPGTSDTTWDNPLTGYGTQYVTTLLQPTNDTLDALKAADPAAYVDVLSDAIKSSLDADKPYQPLLDRLISATSLSTASDLFTGILQSQLARLGYADVDALKGLAAINPAAAQQFAEFAMADAYQRRVVVDTNLGDGSDPTSIQGKSLADIWAILKVLSPSSATAWSDSFNLLKTKPPEMIALTAAQQDAIDAWTGIKKKVLQDNTPPSATTMKGSLEEVLTTVYLDRASTIESMLRDQIATVQNRNTLMGKLNDLLGLLNKASALMPADAKASDTLGAKAGSALTSDLVAQVNAAISSAGVSPFTNGFSTSLTKGELDGSIQQLKSQIDSASNLQQTDMIRLQSLTTKSNESYELVSNFLKKVSDVKDGILANMR